MQGVLWCSEPKDLNKKSVKFIPVYTDNYQITAEQDILFLVNFTSQETETIKNYNDLELIVNLAKRDIQGKAVAFSNKCP
jgi:hypothetical protein